MKPKANASIKRRMILTLLVLSIISVVQVSASSFLQWSQYSNGQKQRGLAELSRNQTYGDMKHDAIQGDIFRLVDAVGRNDDAKRREAAASLEEDIAAMNRSFGVVFAGHYPDTLQARVDAAVAPQHDYVEKAKAVAARLQAHPDDYHRELAAFTASFERFEGIQDALGEAIAAEQESVYAAIDGTLMIAIGVVLLTVAVGAAALGWAGLFVWRSIITPIERLSKVLRAMANGNYSAEIDGDSLGDEVQRMGAAAAVFRQTALAKEAADRDQKVVVGALTVGLGKLAEKDLEYRINDDFPGEYEILRENYNSAVSSLAQALGSVRVGAVAVSNSIKEIRIAADDLARRNEQQAATLEETSAAMNEVTSSVAETAGSAAAVRQTMAHAQLEATEGGDVVERAVTAMAAIEQSAQEIGNITEVIDGIAFQTNLLALNAGVEAARAGDAGKGFAVVANEVRALAQRSADAAKDIKERIEISSLQVGAGVKLVAETGEKLGKIVARVDEMTGLVNEIATAAERQAGNLRQVNTAVNEMDQVTQQNAAMVEETTAATRNLSAEAEQLTRLVSNFQTRNRETRPDNLARPALSRRDSLVAEDPPKMAARPTPSSAPVQSFAVEGNLALKPSDDWDDF
jgi:methyl-accepting chemotaxis protein